MNPPLPERRAVQHLAEVSALFAQWLSGSGRLSPEPREVTLNRGVKGV
jgi:hypothetical protein